MNIKKGISWIFVVAVTVAGVCLFLPTGGDEKTSKAEASLRDGLKKKRKDAAHRKWAENRKPNRRGAEKRNKELEESKLQPADRKLVENIRVALDEEDWDAVQRLTAVAFKSKEAEVRKEAVEALSWFGSRALPELTPMMADSDEEVAEEAMDAWQHALSDVDSAVERIACAKLALGVISNEDALTMIGGEFSSAALEIINDEDDEDKAMEKRVEVIQTLVDLMEGQQELNAKVAGEIYEDITGNEWISVEEAEKYIKDPDNYEPPEDASPETPADGNSESVSAYEM